MKTSVIRTLLITLFVGCLAACAVPGDKTQRVFRYEKAATDIERAIAAWQEQGDYATAVYELETVLQEYSGYGFERRLLGSLAMLHLKYGNTDAFLESMQRLEGHIDENAAISEQYQHLFAVAYAMQDRPAGSLPGRGYDPNRVQVTYQLLGAQP